MKLISFKKAVSLMAVVVLSANTVSAATISSAVYNTKTNTVTLKGTCENILLDSACNGDGNVWVKRNGGNVSSLPESDGAENKVVASKNRTGDYDGIRQDVYTQISENGSGKYRISGKVKADSIINSTVKVFTSNNYNPTVNEVAVTKMDNATISTGIVYVRFLGNKDYTITVNDVKENWISFSKEFDVADTSEIDPSNARIEIYTDNSVVATDAEGNTLKDDLGGNLKVRDTRNIYIDDVTLEKLDYTATVAVKNSLNEKVYINEVNSYENGNYSISFKLPDDCVVENLTAMVNVKDDLKTAAIESNAVNEDIAAVLSNNKVTVSFDMFDFFNSDGYSEVTVVAASYTNDKNLCDVKQIPVTINLDTAATQTIEVTAPTNKVGYVKLFLLNNLNEITPLCDAYQKSVGAN